MTIRHRNDPHPDRQVGLVERGARLRVVSLDHEADVQKFSWVVEASQTFGQGRCDIRLLVKRDEDGDAGQLARRFLGRSDGVETHGFSPHGQRSGDPEAEIGGHDHQSERCRDAEGTGRPDQRGQQHRQQENRQYCGPRPGAPQATTQPFRHATFGGPGQRCTVNLMHAGVQRAIGNNREKAGPEAFGQGRAQIV